MPSVTTLQRYMEKLRPSYGFQENTFTMLAEKSKSLEKSERRGEFNE